LIWIMARRINRAQPALNARETAMFEKFKAMMTQNAVLAEVDGLPDQALADLGVSRAQLAGLVRMPDAVPARMAKMADKFCADMGRLQRDRDTYLDAMEACHHCGAAKTCSKTLSRKDATAADMGFCPNGALYSQIASA
jgi:uncharacterized protein YjiS (DUF1127 family)